MEDKFSRSDSSNSQLRTPFEIECPAVKVQDFNHEIQQETAAFGAADWSRLEQWMWLKSLVTCSYIVGAQLGARSIPPRRHRNNEKSERMLRLQKGSVTKNEMYCRLSPFGPTGTSCQEERNNLQEIAKQLVTVPVLERKVVTRAFLPEDVNETGIQKMNTGSVLRGNESVTYPVPLLLKPDSGVLHRDSKTKTYVSTYIGIRKPVHVFRMHLFSVEKILPSDSNLKSKCVYGVKSPNIEHR